MFYNFFAEKIIYDKKNTHYIITFNLDSQKPGSYKCLLVAEVWFFCLYHK